MKMRAFASRVAMMALELAFAIGSANRSAVAAEVGLGGRVSWARLLTPGPRWNAHADNDPTLARFIRTETSLNIDPICHTADPGRLDTLCAYPFIFTNSLALLAEAPRRNLAEYLRRGGFIYVDGCVSPNVTRDFNQFLQQHRAGFAALLPGSEFRRLAEDDAIYRCYFAVREADFHLAYDPHVVRHRDNDGFYGVFLGDRMVALVSTRALQCAWKPQPARVGACERMIVNIYVYAMTHAGEQTAASRP
jgi:hypothetical protein